MGERPGIGRGFLTIRRARGSDLPAVERIERASFRRKVAYSGRRLAFLLRGTCFVAVAGGAVVGYAAVKSSGARGRIASVAVQPSMRGLGIGERLVRMALSSLARSECRSCALHVEATKRGDAARVLYAKLGFEVRGWRGSWYKDGSPSYYMVKEF